MVIFEADVIAYAFVGDSLSPSLGNQSWAAGSYGCGSRSPAELSTPVGAFVRFMGLCSHANLPCLVNLALSVSSQPILHVFGLWGKLEL